MEYLRSFGYVVDQDGNELSGVASLTMSVNSSYATHAIGSTAWNTSVTANYIWLRCKATIIDDSEWQIDSFRLVVSAPGVGEMEYTPSPGYKEPSQNAYSSVLEGSSRVGWNIYDFIEGHTESPNAKRAILNFYAVFKPRVQQVTITYDANGGEGAPGAETVDQGSYTISETEPTWSGHTFSGWATSAEATQAQYSAGQTITVNADITLYAVWDGEEPTPPGPTPGPHSGYLSMSASGSLQYASSGHLAYD